MASQHHTDTRRFATVFGIGYIAAMAAIVLRWTLFGVRLRRHAFALRHLHDSLFHLNLAFEARLDLLGNPKIESGNHDQREQCRAEQSADDDGSKRRLRRASRFKSK